MNLVDGSRCFATCASLEVQVRYHEGKFADLRAAGAPAEGPAYADPGAPAPAAARLRQPPSPALLAGVASIRHGLSWGALTLSCLPACLPACADSASAALMAVAPVGVTHYRMEQMRV